MFEKTFNQISTLKHKFWVLYYALKLCWVLFVRAMRHDVSKMSKYEEPYFRKYTNRLNGSTYGSKEYHGHVHSLSSGIKHHYKNNSHHPEHYDDGINGMSILDLLEMLIDWRSAVRRHKNGNMRKSLDISQERFGMTDRQKEQLIEASKEIGLIGEKHERR